MTDGLVKRHLLIKRGLYYAPNRQGYTGVKERAGRYHEVEALGLDGVTAIHEDEAPDFSPACWEETKIAVLTDHIASLTAENERLREALNDILTRFEPWSPHDHIADKAARAALGDTQ